MSRPRPNVVEVFEAGEVEGRTFVAMELVQGPDAGGNRTGPGAWWYR